MIHTQSLHERSRGKVVEIIRCIFPIYVSLRCLWLVFGFGTRVVVLVSVRSDRDLPQETGTANNYSLDPYQARQSLR